MRDAAGCHTNGVVPCWLIGYPGWGDTWTTSLQALVFDCSISCHQQLLLHMPQQSITGIFNQVQYLIKSFCTPMVRIRYYRRIMR